MIPTMKARDHPKIIWPSTPGGTGPERRQTYCESEAVLTKVHPSVTHLSVPLSCEFEGNSHTYDVMLNDADQAFAERLAAEFSRHVGGTLKQLGDLEIDF
jgi:hypothetical protein